MSCAKAAPNSTGSGGSKGSGGSSASGGSNGSGSGGNNNSGGNNGSGGSSSSGGNSASGGNGSGGSVSSGGSTGSGGSSSSGSGGNSSSGGNTGSGGKGGASGSGGSTGSGGSSQSTDGGGTDASCQTAALTWAPQIPTVFVLVDQSGSEFSNGTNSTFYTLRTAVLNVVNKLQSQVRFGVGVFTGNYQISPIQCPIWATVAPDINNYAKINTLYSAQTQPGFKAETPAVMVLPLVQKALASDTGTGAKYILFATDSETDFCDDGAPDCPVDAVTYMLQSLYMGTPSIGTMVIGLPATGDNLASEALQNYANAGAGLNVVFPTASGVQTENQLYQTCKMRSGSAGQYGWPGLYALTGKPATDSGGLAIATYGTANGNAPVFTPASTSETDLEKQITAAINGVKSCSFDLSNVGGKSIKVDTTQLGKASIQIEGTTIAQDATNGWSMSSATTLDLNGTACTTWRMPNTTHISFGFPCSIIIFE